MPEGLDPHSIARLLVVMPTWLGDCVMATPTLRALRRTFPAPDTQITLLLRKNVRPTVAGSPWYDRLVSLRGDRRDGSVGQARRLASRKFDAAVLLPNSFRTAFIVAAAGVKRRIGYDRDGRGFLLTDRLIPRRNGDGFVPVPTLDYYLGLARYMGASDPDPTMELFTRPEDDAAADALLASAGFGPDDPRPLVLLNPGAQKKPKRWPAERFGDLADRLADRFGACVALTGAPSERPILDDVAHAAEAPVINLAARPINLTLVKSIVRRAALMVTNDTGPRHIAAALKVPVVTLFGPTAPQWTEIGFDRERQVISPGVSPEHDRERDYISARRSMHRITVDSVFEAALDLLSSSPHRRPRGVVAAP